MSKRRSRQMSDGQKIDLMRQALAAADRFTRLANALMEEFQPQMPEASGITGVFKGFFMVTTDGAKYPVAGSYAAKSQLVFGDHLKLLEEEDGEKYFKQVERMRRIKTSAVLARKDGILVAVAENGTYDVLPEAAEMYNVKEGDKVEVLLPEGDHHVPFATLVGAESVNNEHKLYPTMPEEKSREIKEALPIKPSAKVAPAPKKVIEKPEEIKSDEVISPVIEIPIVEEVTPVSLPISPVSAPTVSPSTPTADPGRELEEDDLR